jgi:hypothetical protein
MSVEHLMAAEPQHHHQADRREEIEDRQIERADAGRGEGLAIDVVGFDPQPARLHGLGREPLDDADARHRLLDHR